MSFYTSLLRHLGSAVALVAVVAAAFWGVGQMRSPGDDIAIDDDPAAQPASPRPAAATDPTVAPTAPASGSSDPTATGDPAASAAPSATTPTAEATGTPASPAATEEPTSAPETSEETSEGVPTSETSVQVLNGVALGSDAGQQVADMLEDDGYDIVVVQSAAVGYDTSTVFWTPGHEEEARQLASAHGFAQVAEKPSNLSDNVDVHVVVGSDRG